jgi:hypothetical protein
MYSSDSTYFFLWTVAIPQSLSSVYAYSTYTYKSCSDGSIVSGDSNCPMQYKCTTDQYWNGYSCIKSPVYNYTYNPHMDEVFNMKTEDFKSNGTQGNSYVHVAPLPYSQIVPPPIQTVPYYDQPTAYTPIQASNVVHSQPSISKLCYLGDWYCMYGGATYQYTPSYSWSTYGSSQYAYTQ